MFMNTTAHANADALNRLPLLVVPAKSSTRLEIVLLLEHLEGSQVTANDDICVWTNRDPKLSRVLQYLQQGWPSEGDSDLNVYFSQ